ncbi:MAG: DUF4252 domain-containing protein [Syntrophothermus sp.]
MLLFFLLTFTCSSFAQYGDYKKEPGYIEFGDLTSFESGEKVTEVMLDERLLKLAAGFTHKEDPQLQTLLSGLKLVKVNTFEVSDKNEDGLLNKMKSIDNELTNKKWDRIVKTRDKKENTNVYIKTNSDNTVVGLVVTTFQRNGEAAFINIVGNIDLESISKLSNNFNIPSLDSIKHKKR